MQDFRPLWKERHHNKQNTFRDSIQRCILIGMHRGETFEEMVEMAHAALDRSFASDCYGSYDRLARELGRASSSLGFARQVGLTEEEAETYEKIRAELRKSEWLNKLGIHYSYIFMLGNLIPEQVCVQGMHASMKVGQELTAQKKWPKGVNAKNLHYVMVKAEKPGDIARYLISKGIQYSVYNDYDYEFGPDGELIQSEKQSAKSIMTYPIPRYKRGVFSEFELLRFEPSGPDKRTV
jgi:hypothetical protein